MPAPITPSPLLTNPVPAKIFPNKPERNIPNKLPTNPPFCFFGSFSIVSLTSFVSKQDPSKDSTSSSSDYSSLNIFMISFKSLFKNTNVVLPDLKMFF